MKKYDKLIFISRGDTAEGPVAEAILQSRYLLEELTVTSKGLIVLLPEPINPKAEAILASHGLTQKDHMSEPLVQEDFDERTLLLTMTERLREDVLEAFPEMPDTSVHTLNTFLEEPSELSDPYGGSLADYEACYEELEKLITKLVVKLNEEELLC